MGAANPFREMWERAFGGDRDARADLYLEYGPHLRRVIHMKLRDLKIEWAVEPDDLLDSFFIRLYNGGVRIRINDALHFTNYCEQALRNKCVRVLRSVILRRATRIEDCPPELFEDPNAAEDLESFSWSEQLEQAYAQLTQLERVVCFYRIDGQTWQEIGQRLGKSADAVRMIHQRAADRLGCEIFAGGRAAKSKLLGGAAGRLN